MSGKTVEDLEHKSEFLARELIYNQQVREALTGIRTVDQILDQVEQASSERRILDALHLLESTYARVYEDTKLTRHRVLGRDRQDFCWPVMPSYSPA